MRHVMAHGHVFDRRDRSTVIPAAAPRSSDRVPPVHLALTLVIIIWNVVLAGRIAQLRQASRPFATITGLAGLLLVPAYIVAIATTTLITGRAIPFSTVRAGGAIAEKVIDQMRNARVLGAPQRQEWKIAKVIAATDTVLSSGAPLIS